jgi:hypothetical protein
MPVHTVASNVKGSIARDSSTIGGYRHSGCRPCSGGPSAIITSLKLYENVVIGGYLFDLGVRMAKLRPDLPLVSVNLLQQTPSDRLLGDVLFANAAVFRLIEFKRAGELTRKERKKLAILQKGVINNNLEMDLTDLSREVHWYIEIDEPRVLGEPVISRACPYLDFDKDPEFIGIQDLDIGPDTPKYEQKISRGYGMSL